ncbi:MAG TPA: tetratricopeptide repeat protein [Spirochaetota bacterium]|nr:tetratricopeptide repeat protein [Spirochaetota bacterium]HPI90249.1 tetratricopeptide repeat protein [Spirochaetota bacterium]HPR46510.1 tetratricopeptide repeat protein [Spirochaetota bacterium]
MANGMSSPSGIAPRTYKSGSIIYFEGDKSEYIYVLKSGRVVLTSVKLDTGEEVKEEVRQGEFFGVKSALGRYPREETAQTIGETIVLVLSLSDFERLVLRNVNVVRKMLRVFSNQLRRINKTQRTVLGEKDTINPDAELFRIGEYYFKTAVFQQAQYAYKKLMEYYPDSKYAGTAMDRINAIASGNTAVPVSGMEAMDDIQPDSAGFDDFDLEDKGGSDFEPAPAGADAGSGSLSDEMDDFLSDDSLGDLDDFTIDEPGGVDENFIPHLFENARELFDEGHVDQALEVYEKIISSDDIVSDDDKRIYENSHFEIGRCYMKQGKPREAMASFSTVIKNFPRSENVKKAFFYVGQIFESAKQKDKALVYYKKAASMAPGDSVSQQAAARIRQLQG